MSDVINIYKYTLDSTSTGNNEIIYRASDFSFLMSFKGPSALSTC